MNNQEFREFLNIIHGKRVIDGVMKNNALEFKYITKGIKITHYSVLRTKLLIKIVKYSLKHQRN